MPPRAGPAHPLPGAVHCQAAPGTSALSSPTLQDSPGCCCRKPGEPRQVPALAPTAHPQRDKHELPRPPTSSEGLPTSPASLRCVPSHKDLCQNKCESLAACGRSCAGLKYSIHMVKSDQMQLFLLTSYTHAGRFSIQLF